MNNFRNKTVVITGAASGIGKGLAQRFAEAGAKLVLSDIETQRLNEVASELDRTTEVISVETDVSSIDQVQHLADKTYDAFGDCHVICNNAGVAENNLKTWELSQQDWDWVLGVNLHGVVNGISAFVPRMLESEQPGHVVNTASIGGLVAGLALPAYSVSKHAVVALSECLYNDLTRERADIGVSVLCPGWINTDIGDSDRNRKDRSELSQSLQRSRDAFKESIAKGLDPLKVGDIVLQGIIENRFYLYTHPHWNNAIKDRFDCIMSGEKPASTYLPRN